MQQTWAFSQNMKKVFCVGDSTELLRGVDIFSTERRPISLTNLAFAGMELQLVLHAGDVKNKQRNNSAH